MKFLSLSVPGYGEIQAPQEIQNLTQNAGDFGGNFIRVGVQIMLIAVILTALGYIIFGGFKFITSRGDKEALRRNRDHITNALIGLIVALSALFALGLIGFLFKIKLIGF